MYIANPVIYSNTPVHVHLGDSMITFMELYLRVWTTNYFAIAPTYKILLIQTWRHIPITSTAYKRISVRKNIQTSVLKLTDLF